MLPGSVILLIMVMGLQFLLTKITVLAIPTRAQIKPPLPILVEGSAPLELTTRIGPRLQEVQWFITRLKPVRYRYVLWGLCECRSW